MAFYFAYGNNMNPETMRKRLEGEGENLRYKYIARARLCNYRLAFTTTTPEWDDNYVSDVISDDGFAVYGVLYDVDEKVFDALAPYEPTYSPEAVNVEHFEDAFDFDSSVDPTIDRCTRVSATAFIVPEEKKKAEGNPHGPYLNRLISAAEQRKLPRLYVEALHSMKVPDSLDAVAGLVALRTRNRGRDKPLPIIQLASHFKEKYKLDQYALVTYEHRCCIAEVQTRSDLEDKGRVCGVDENLRIRLALPTQEPGLELYGACVKVYPASKSLVPRQLKNPRSLILWLDRVYYIDSEKEICVINRSILDLLGGEPGDYVRITAFFEDAGAGKTRTIIRRAMCDESGKWPHSPSEETYPKIGTVHLDESAREELGFHHIDSVKKFRENVKDYPVLVSLSVKHLIKKRLYMYLYSFIGAFIGFTIIGLNILKILDNTNQSSLVSVMYVVSLSLGVSLLILLGLINFDIKQRVNP